MVAIVELRDMLKQCKRYFTSINFMLSEAGVHSLLSKSIDDDMTSSSIIIGE